MNGKFYWLKLKKDFFKRHDIRIIESMPNGKDYILFYLKLLVESVDHEGALRFSDTIPYNAEMLSVITNTNADIVKSALEVFVNLKMIELLDDQTIYMNEVSKMIGSAADNDNAIRQQRFRDNQKALKSRALEAGVTKSNAGVTPPVTNNNESKSIDIDKERDIEIDINRDISSIIPREVAEMENLFNQFWSVYPKKVDKKGAFKAFKNVKDIKKILPDILADLETKRGSQEWTKNNGQYIPHPTTYLHQERWKDSNEVADKQNAIEDIAREKFDDFLL